MPDCPECGFPFDELPFDLCETHRRYLATEAGITDDEFEADLEYLMAEALHGAL